MADFPKSNPLSSTPVASSSVGKQEDKVTKDPLSKDIVDPDPVQTGATFQQRVEKETASAQVNRDSRSKYFKSKIKAIIEELKKDNVIGDQRYNLHLELDKLIDEL